MSRSIAWILAFTLLITPGCLSNGEIDEFYGEDINPPIAVNEFVLIDDKGEYVTMSQFEGQVVVVAFLFTRCPDICPVVSANLAFIAQELGELHGTSVQIITVTVDPWTDNSSVLGNYADVRGLSWPHLTGSVEDLEPVWMNFDVGLATYDTDIDNDGVADGFDSCPDTPEGEGVDNNGCGKDTQQPDGEVVTNHHPLDYWVDHTTGTIIVDKNMEQRVWWGDTDWNPELVLEDILSLVEEE
ncbi:MAG: SCO family protein [Candidatus Thalassarchaeaceae archaeon]|nr:SCO family protein [Candidatus Thalassarchaeaceae archaeon]